MAVSLFAILTVITSAAFNLVLKGAVAAWPVAWAGLLSRCVTLPLLGVWVVGRGAGWRRLGAGHTWRALLSMGAISVAINLLWFGSLQLTAATNVATLMCMDLVFVVLLGSALRLERIRAAELSLLPVMLAGMALLAGVADGGWKGHWLGDLMAVMAAGGYAVNAFIIRGILRSMDEEAVALYNHGLSTVGFAILAWLGASSGTYADIRPGPAGWAWIAALGVVAAVSLPIYYAALHRLQLWKLRAWLLLSPVLVATVEWLTGVRLTGWQWAGAGLVLTGLLLLIRMELRPGKVRQAPQVGTIVSPDDVARSIWKARS